MSSKTIPKANALEKVGNFVIGDGVLQVIEYSDLPESLAKQTNPDGGLNSTPARLRSTRCGVTSSSGSTRAVG
jgi:UDP-N-acetylglucosamine pyrophosphorylase